MLQLGRPSPDAIAELIERYPGQQSRILELLHQTVGNSFVQQVVQRTALAGFEGTAEPLPHLDRIQESFGGHDIRDIDAHVGGPATDAADELGATAYTSDDRIAFSRTPDLHTAAHEAAHVVQNRASAELNPMGADGALTTPGDEREQHADEIADRVVRGESAASLLASSPIGASEIARKPANVSAPADSTAAMAELATELELGIKHPERIAVLVAMLSPDDRIAVRDNKLGILEAGCTASQMITIATALELTPVQVVRIGLRKHATARELAPALSQLGDDVVDMANDPAELALLQKALPGPITSHFPSLSPMFPNVAGSAPIMHWFVDTLTARAFWRLISGATQKANIAATLNQENLWAWIHELDGRALSTFDVTQMREYGRLAHHPYNDELEAKANAGPQPVAHDPDDEAASAAAAKQEDAARVDALGSLRAVLAGGSAIDRDKLAVLIGATNGAGAVLAKDAHARQRLTRALGVNELESAVNAFQFGISDRVDWLLDAPGVTSKILLSELADQSDDRDRLFQTPARVAKLHKALGDETSFMTAIGGSRAIQEAALKNDQLRSWILGSGSAIDIYRFVTMGNSADSVSRACNAIAKPVGFGWVYELVNLETDTVKLRELALALPDKTAAAHLMKYAVGDSALTMDAPITTAVPSDPGLRASPDKRLHDDVSSNGASVAADTAVLSDDERSAARADHAFVSSAITSATRDGTSYDAVRTARELDGPLPDTLRAFGADARSVDHGAFRSYARERPAAEQVAIASDPTLAGIAEKLLNYSPFHTLAGVRQPTALAAVLVANPKFLEWVTNTTNPVEAIMLLGATPEVAVAAARAFESTNVDLIKELPEAELTANQKSALARIGENATGAKLHNAVSDRLAGDPDNKHNVAHARAVNDKHLAATLDRFRTESVDAKDVQAACSAHPASEALDVLLDAAHPQRVDYLRQTLQVSPLNVFSWMANEPNPFLNRAVTDWILATEEPIGALRMLSTAPAAILTVAAAIDTNSTGSQHWLMNLPGGYGYSTKDEATLQAVFRTVNTMGAAKWVFEARFGRLPDGEWSREGLDKLWATLGRLDDRQLGGNNNLGGFSKIGPDEDSANAGYYTPGTGIVHLKDEVSRNESRYENSHWQSKAQLATELGVDEADIDRRHTAGLVESKVDQATTLFRVKAVESNLFTDTVLHETGHAVDAMLGSRTDLVFGMAGWKSYSGGDFDGWAAEMNAFGGAATSSEDKTQIKEAFEQRLKSSNAIHGPGVGLDDFVPESNALKQL